MLVFDDCDASRTKMVRALERAGLEVSRATSALEMTRSILRGEAKVVVVAAHVRDLSCDRLLGLIRAVDRVDSLRVVMACENRGPTTDRLAATAGADAVFVHTDGEAMLVHLVRELLEPVPRSGPRVRPAGPDPR